MNTQFEGTAKPLCGCAQGSFCLDASVDPPQPCEGHPLDRDAEDQKCVPCTGDEYGDFECPGLFECAPLLGQELLPLHPGCCVRPRSSMGRSRSPQDLKYLLASCRLHRGHRHKAC